MFFDQYPYTNMHNVNLDWVLQAVKSWGAMVEQNNQNFINLEAANQSFKEYVTNYITNLDVQEEINTKLDMMLESGQLSPYLQPYVVTEVDSWLGEHLTPTSPSLDSTLTLANAAAQAKAVGDALKIKSFSENAKGALISLLSIMAVKDGENARELYDDLVYFLTHESANVREMYRVQNPVTFTGDSSEVIHTGIYLLKIDRSFTITFEFTFGGQHTNSSYIFSCMEGVSPYWGLKPQIVNNALSIVMYGSNVGIANTDINVDGTGTYKFVIRHKAGESQANIKFNTSWRTLEYTRGSSIKTINNELLIGGGGLYGTLNAFILYSGYMSDDEVNTYLGV